MPTRSCCPSPGMRFPLREPLVFDDTRLATSETIPVVLENAARFGEAPYQTGERQQRGVAPRSVIRQLAQEKPAQLDRVDRQEPERVTHRRKYPERSSGGNQGTPKQGPTPLGNEVALPARTVERRDLGQGVSTKHRATTPMAEAGDIRAG